MSCSKQLLRKHHISCTNRTSHGLTWDSWRKKINQNSRRETPCTTLGVLFFFHFYASGSVNIAMISKRLRIPLESRVKWRTWTSGKARSPNTIGQGLAQTRWLGSHKAIMQISRPWVRGCWLSWSPQWWLLLWAVCHWFLKFGRLCIWHPQDDPDSTWEPALPLSPRRSHHPLMMACSQGGGPTAHRSLTKPASVFLVSSPPFLPRLVVSTHLKNMLVKLDSMSPRIRGENTKKNL